MSPLLGPGLLFDHLNDQGNGTYTASLADGAYVSIQPDGTQQTRIIGQSYGTPPTVWTGPGAYEIFTLNGTPQTASVMAFAPAGKPILFPFITAVPNS